MKYNFFTFPGYSINKKIEKKTTDSYFTKKIYV